MRSLWTGERGTRRWFCMGCPGGSRTFRTKALAEAHQRETNHRGTGRGAKLN